MKILHILCVVALLVIASLLLGCAIPPGHRYHPCMDKDPAGCPQWAQDVLRSHHPALMANTNETPKFSLDIPQDQKEK